MALAKGLTLMGRLAKMKPEPAQPWQKMTDYLTVILQSLGGGLLLTVLMGGFDFLTWGELFGMFAIFSFGLSFVFAREMFGRNRSS